MTNRKGTAGKITIHKAPHRNPKIEQNEPEKKRVNLCAPEGRQFLNTQGEIFQNLSVRFDRETRKAMTALDIGPFNLSSQNKFCLHPVLEKG